MNTSLKAKTSTTKVVTNHGKHKNIKDSTFTGQKFDFKNALHLLASYFGMVDLLERVILFAKEETFCA